MSKAEKENKNYYNNFFIGIPLPDEVLSDYKKFLETAAKKYPYFKITKSKFPHITISFLGKQDKNRVEVIKKAVEDNVHMLKGDKIRIEKFGFFRNRHTDVVYLQVEKNKSLEKFHTSLSKEIEDIFETKWHDFIPHLTIARVKRKDRKKFSQHKKEIEKLFNNTEFVFEVNEVGVFGRDPDKKNKLVKIESISVF